MELTRSTSLGQDTESPLPFSLVTSLFFPHFFVFPYAKLSLCDLCISPTTLWELNAQHTLYLFPAKCRLQPSYCSLPNNKMHFCLINKKFCSELARLFELTSSAGQWIHIWVVLANRECCHQWGASYVRVIQLHSHKNMRLKVSSQISTVFDDSEYGHTVSENPLPSWSRGLLFEQIF